MRRFLFWNKYTALACIADGWERLKNYDCKVYEEDEHGTIMKQHAQSWYTEPKVHAGHKVYLVVKTFVDTNDSYAVQNVFRLAIVADEHREAYIKNMAIERQIVADFDVIRQIDPVEMPFKTFINKAADAAWNIGRDPKAYGESAVWAMDTFHDLHKAAKLADSF